MIKISRAGFRSLLMALPFFLLTGCAPAFFALNAMGAGISKATDYILANNVARTVNYDIALMKESILTTLNKMEIDLRECRITEEGEIITAAAINMEITIELKKLTPTLTRMDITALNGPVKRDKATAQEIIDQSIHVAERLSIPEDMDGTLALSMAYQPAPPVKTSISK